MTHALHGVRLSSSRSPSALGLHGRAAPARSAGPEGCAAALPGIFRRRGDRRILLACTARGVSALIQKHQRAHRKAMQWHAPQTQGRTRGGGGGGRRRAAKAGCGGGRHERVGRADRGTMQWTRISSAAQDARQARLAAWYRPAWRHGTGPPGGMAQAAAGDARSKSWEPRACAEHGDVGAAYVCVGTVSAESSNSNLSRPPGGPAPACCCVSPPLGTRQTCSRAAGCARV